MKILFLCSQNKRRSLTAEKYFDGYNGHQARSAGTENNSRIKVTEELLGWADIIFRIKEKYPDTLAGKKVICLNIPDEYAYMDDDLIEALDSAVSGYL